MAKRVRVSHHAAPKRGSLQVARSPGLQKPRCVEKALMWGQNVSLTFLGGRF